MQAVIKIDMDNAAFRPRPGGELARVLRKLADRIDQGGGRPSDLDGAKIRDVNGNTVGKMEIEL
jgi:hypothetical protein